MEILKVGQKFPGSYQREGLILNYSKGFTLLICLPNITEKEAEGFQKGNYKFALTELNGLLWFLSEFKGAIDMSDSPFHFGLYRDNRINDLPKTVNEGQGIALNVIAVDSHSGTVKSIRYIGLSTDFSRKLINICYKQSMETITKELVDMKINEVQLRYSADDLYRYSKTRCKQ